MSNAPKPVVLTTQTTASYTEPGDPQPFVVVGGLPIKSQVSALTAIATADAIDAATTQALANEIKAKVNAIIAALKA